MRKFVEISTVLFLAALSHVDGQNYGKGSCRAAKVCCDGKNPDCAVQVNGEGLSVLLKDLGEGEDGYYDYYSDEEPCYCDHDCMKVGDCCNDFKDYCGVYDCKVSHWSEWSECDASCGEGQSTRKRQVLRPESNGGKECPQLEESQPCQVEECSRVDLDSELAVGETAILLAGKYARQKPKSFDYLRKNLKSYRQRKEKENYCVVFEVNKVSRSCRKFSETQRLKPGHRICALCDDRAHRDLNEGHRCTGHGVEDKATKFKTLMNPRCHGKWTRLELHHDSPDCKACKPQTGTDFLFI